MSQYVERLVVSDDAGQWNVSCDANGTSCHQTLRTANGVIVGFVVDHRKDYSEPDTRANARRLVACWNACDGVPTDALEQIDGLAKAVLPYHQIKAHLAQDPKGSKK